MGFSAGFTLIEMLVVFSLLFTFSTVGIVSYVQFNNTQSLDTSTSEFTTMLNTARMRAVSQVVPAAATSCAGQILKGYQVNLTPSWKDYEIDILCGGNVVTLDKQKLSNNICFNSSSNGPVIFNVADGTTKPTTITINGVDKSKIISVDNAGNVSVSEVNASSGCSSTPPPTSTPVPANTLTPIPINTSVPASTSTPTPIQVPTPTPTSTPTPTPTSTPTPTPVIAIVSGQVYRLVNQCSNKVLAVAGSSTADGVDVTQWTWNGGADQQWKIEGVSSSHYRLTAQHSGKVLAIAGSSTDIGADVIQWTWNGGADQQWGMTNLGNGFFTLFNRNSGNVLDVDHSSTQDGANVWQWISNGTCAQTWQIIKI
jgi:Tfp pilus assembly protein FimT